MNDRDAPDAATDMLDRFSRFPPFSDFSALLPRLVETDEYDVGGSLARLADLVGAPEESLSIRFNVADGDAVRSWTLDAGPKGGKVTARASSKQPDVELILEAETWRLIAEGRMSLLEAFGKGRMRVRGDIDAARRFAGRLQPSDAGPS